MGSVQAGANTGRGAGANDTIPIKKRLYCELKGQGNIFILFKQLSPHLNGITQFGANYRKIPNTLVTFQISSLWGSLLSGGASLLSGNKKRHIKLVRLNFFPKSRTKIRKKIFKN